MTAPFTYTEAQRAAVTNLGQSLVVTAGAGSGKTRVLVDRYVNLIDPTRPGGPLATPESVAAITFTNKAAREMLDRVRRAVRERLEASRDAEERRLWQGVLERTAAARIRTIHSFCSELVREFPVEAGIDPEAAVLDDFAAGELLAEAARKAILKLLDGDRTIRRLAVEKGLEALTAELLGLYRSLRAAGEDLAEAERATLAGLAAAAESGGETADKAAGEVVPEAARAYFRLLARLDREYAALKTPAALDYEDLQLLARNLLRERPDVRSRLRARFRYLLVDEFQDTDALQHEIVALLAGDPPGERLFVVGDPKQSIYRFRHAEVGLFEEIQRWVKERQGDVLLLAENFRSQPGLVEFVNALFSRLMPAGYEPLAPGRQTEARYPAVELLLADRGPGEKNGTAVLKEARLLAARLKAMVEGGEELVSQRPAAGGPEERRAVRYGDVAILFRTRTRLKVFEKALAEQGIPYFVVGGIGFYRKPEVVDLISLLRAVDDPDDRLSLVAALRSPLFSVPDDALLLLVQRYGDLNRGLVAMEASDQSPFDRETEERLRRAATLLAQARALRSRLSVPEFLDFLLERTGYPAALAVRTGGARRLANLRKLRRVATELTQGACFSLTDFLAYFDRLVEKSDEAEAAIETEAGDAVKLLTVHAAKGLEFPVVAVADLGQKFPATAARWRHSRGRGIGFCLPGGGKPVPTALQERLAAEAAEQDRVELVRLLYVAVTRARDHLILSGCREAPEPDGRGKKPQCWLTWIMEALPSLELPAGLLAETAPPVPAEPSAPVAAHTAAASAPAAPPPTAPPAAAPAPAAASPLPWPGRRVAVATVSELMCFAACPRWYHLRYRLGVPPAAEWEGPGGEEGHEDAEPGASSSGVGLWTEAGAGTGSGPLTPVTRGSVVHRVIERLRRPQDLDFVLREALREAGVAEAAEAEAAALLRPLLVAYLEGEEFAAVGRGEVVAAEAPFFVRLAPNFLLRGVVDRIDRVPGGLRLLDFKTNLVPEGRARAEADGYYRLQLPLYALAVEEVWREAVRSAAFVFLAPKTCVEVDLSSAARAEAREEAVRLAREIETGAQDPRPSPFCSQCGYGPLCDAGRAGRTR
ncbi:MAG TPA: UvrD-helicase domain-containing protein [Firmicutes bacterium]|nr:UvrD-helicase domain-containing protein [Bacillota bacterium]